MAHKAAACGKTAKGARFGGGFSPSAFTPKFAGLKSVQEFLPAVAKPAFEKYGFSSSEILTNWAAYAGADIASYTAPERLKWPRADMTEKSGSQSSNGAKSGATLVLRVGGARALELQHKLPQLLERVNSAFGYRAVTTIRILQAPLPEKPISRVVSQPPPPRHQHKVAHVSDPRLREALAVISAGVEARNRLQPGHVRTGF